MLDAEAKAAIDTLRSRVSSARGVAALQTLEEECASSDKASGGKPKKGFPSKETVRGYADDNARGKSQPALAGMASRARG